MHPENITPDLTDWRLADHGEIVDSRNVFVASIRGECRHDREPQVGKLIAAAPMLLNALRDLMASLIDSESDRDQETGEQYDDCRAACEAIEAATGQPWPPAIA